MRTPSLYCFYTVLESREMTETSPAHSLKTHIHPAGPWPAVSLKTHVFIQFCDFFVCPPFSLRWPLKDGCRHFWVYLKCFNFSRILSVGSPFCMACWENPIIWSLGSLNYVSDASSLLSILFILFLCTFLLRSNSYVALCKFRMYSVIWYTCTLGNDYHRSVS